MNRGNGIDGLFYFFFSDGVMDDLQCTHLLHHSSFFGGADFRPFIDYYCYYYFRSAQKNEDVLYDQIFQLSGLVLINHSLHFFYNFWLKAFNPSLKKK